MQSYSNRNTEVIQIAFSKIRQTARTRLAGVAPRAATNGKPIARLWIHGAMVGILYFIIVYAFTSIIKGVSSVSVFLAMWVFLFVVTSMIL